MLMTESAETDDNWVPKEQVRRGLILEHILKALRIVTKIKRGATEGDKTACDDKRVEARLP